MKINYLFGIRPTTNLHLGNYFIFKNILKLQKNLKYNERLLVMIADLHANISNRTTILNIIKLFYSCGLDNNKTIIFLQSKLPYHCELQTLLFKFIKTGEMKRMIQFKEKTKINKEYETEIFLLNYPILMAADILIHKTSYVVIGADQEQHFEFTKKIAFRINKIIKKDIFIIPKKYLIKQDETRLLDLKRKNKKMSKSFPQGALFLTEKKTNYKKKILTALTDNKKNISYNPKEQPEISNLLLIYSFLIKKTIPNTIQILKSLDNDYFKFKKNIFFEFNKFVSALKIKMKQIKIKEINKILKKNHKKLFLESKNNFSFFYKQIYKNIR